MDANERVRISYVTLKNKKNSIYLTFARVRDLMKSSDPPADKKRSPYLKIGRPIRRTIVYFRKSDRLFLSLAFFKKSITLCEIRVKYTDGSVVDLQNL